MKTLRGLVALLILSLPLSCEKPDAPPPHVFLITIDTLRADHLETYGYSLATSPFLKSLGADCTVFENAIAPCPSTAPSIASILTGLYRTAHGVERNGAILQDEVTTMAERLKSLGYRTMGMVTNPVLVELDSRLEAAGGRGFSQGFDRFEMPAEVPREGAGKFDGHRLPEVASRWIEESPRGVPLFLWVHFVEPHGPYNPPSDYLEKFSPSDYNWEGPDELPTAGSNYGYDVIPHYQAEGAQSKTVPDYLAAYDAEIRYVDDHVRRLVSAIQEKGAWDDSLFILTSDHGESLGEHRYYFQHGYHLYEGSTRVPLMIKAPKIFPKNHRVEQTVSLVDILPTVLDYLNEEDMSPFAEGSSMIPLVAAEETPPSHLAYSETYYGNRLTSLRKDRWKYILTPKPPSGETDPRWKDGWNDQWPTQWGEEVYDLEKDPGELQNLAQNNRYATPFRRTMSGWLKSQEENPLALTPVFQNDENLAKVLEELGYTLKSESQSPESRDNK